MSAHHYGPSLSDQGFGPEDAMVGQCAVCTHPLDVASMETGAVYRDDRFLCADCACGNWRCGGGCDEPVDSEGAWCRECSDDTSESDVDATEREARLSESSNTPPA